MGQSSYIMGKPSGTAKLVSIEIKVIALISVFIFFMNAHMCNVQIYVYM
jgi:hypothetical protein